MPRHPLDVAVGLALFRGITVTDVRSCQDRPWGMPRSHYEGQSYIIGRDEIVLGFYSNEEWRVAALLHEIGHVVSHDRWTGTDVWEEAIHHAREMERLAWEEALWLAGRSGIDWTRSMTEYMERCLDTYPERGHP